VSLKITKDTLTLNLADFNERAEKAIAEIFKYWAVRASSEMRVGARWTDRTGNARAALYAVSSSNNDHFVLNFIHGMPYGVWLEIRWSGRYAIIGPTMAAVAPRLAAMVGQAILDLKKG
jgi:hypothetical protein